MGRAMTDFWQRLQQRKLVQWAVASLREADMIRNSSPGQTTQVPR